MTRSFDNVALADINAAPGVDLDHYSKRGWLPKLPASLTGAIAEHRRISGSYSKAIGAQFEWEARSTNLAQAGTRGAVAAAIARGEDPEAAQTKAKQDIIDAGTRHESAKEIVFAHYKPVHAASGALMAEVAEWAEAEPHLAKTVDKLKAAVDKARAALVLAEVDYNEASRLETWLKDTYPGPGRTFPSTFGLTTLAEPNDPDDDA